jgi:hypothetical protein
LKDNKQWDSVHRTLKAQTSCQDVDDVLNPNYLPKSAEETELFNEKQKQKYMYLVFERILQTDEGKVIVHSHDPDHNAQKIYKEFLEVMTQSTEALMDSGSLLSYLTTAKINDGSWRGNTKAFVLNWVDKLRLFHDLTPAADRLSESVQRTLLQNAVLSLNVLQQVQTNADLQQATQGVALTFTQYCGLLINSATGYNKRSDAKPTNSNGGSRRLVFSSETIYGNDGAYEDETSDLKYGVDTSADEIQAYTTNRGRASDRPQFKSDSRMPIARWKSLGEDAKKIWDTMDDDDKVKVLALHENRKDTPQSDRSKFSVNTHNTLTQDTSYDDLNSALLAMVTKHSNRPKPSSHNGDIRSVLSQPVKKAKAQVQDDTVELNGQKYVRQVQSRDTNYSVSAAARKTKGSLIDCGANGGIAGGDTRIITHHPHRTVDIRDIDNHEITSIPIVSAGAVARSQRGNGIAILHQYAFNPQRQFNWKPLPLRSTPI